jgi:hypothetical protein
VQSIGASSTSSPATTSRLSLARPPARPRTSPPISLPGPASRSRNDPRGGWHAPQLCRYVDRVAHRRGGRTIPPLEGVQSRRR